MGRHLRLVDPLRPPPLRPPHGGRGLPPPRARLPDRRLQERGRARPAPRVELGHRRRDAAPDPLPLLHRLPAALGPARLLGGHGRHQHRRLDPLRRAPHPRAPDRRARHRPGDAHPLLRPARDPPARRPGRALRVPHVADPEGRRPRPRRPRGDAAGEGGRGAGQDEDLHAPRRRPGHGPDHPRREPRGPRPHRQRGARPRPPRGGRRARHLRGDQRPGLASSARRSRRRPTPS